MKIFFYTIPVALLVAYSQLVVKWRTISTSVAHFDGSWIGRLVGYFSDPYILSAYFSALLGSFVWLIVISRVPLSIGFPIYIGSTFLLVLIGSWTLLGEPISPVKLSAAFLILIGIILGGLE